MTTPAPRPTSAATSPTPLTAPAATPYVPAWCYYIYDQRAFVTYDARLVATAAVTTPAQEARIEGVFDRLTHGHAARRAAVGAPATRLALDRR